MSPSRRVDALRPWRSEEERAQKRSGRISRMFDAIAPTYDLLNHVLSANVDRRWRRSAVALLSLRGNERILDACTGTGDLAMALRAGGAAYVEACDFAPEMIRRAREKSGAGDVTWRVADVLALPHPDGSFDAATVAFGVRNFEDLDRGLHELGRVLNPGGRLLILEFSRPSNPIVRCVYEAYSLLVLPLVGNIVSGGSDNAYAYLPRSVRSFPEPEALAARIRGAGFVEVTAHPLTGGIAHLHLARRPG